ncbi:hypothetical protein NDU88_002755 [Pleurodeles waltl]|uniref:Retrotransposon gag domain-containing protein n=1 Tax=Pleurodeles waltl TaxID=8319 RepID=A0AAV7V0L0_PLEWA|nr:hypothetical protein NDU88_002755 [Pleurodeles waltl]
MIATPGIAHLKYPYPGMTQEENLQTCGIYLHPRGDRAAGEKKTTGARRDHFKQPDTTSSGRHRRNHATEANKSAQQLGGDADRRGRPAARDTTALQPVTARTRKHLRPQVSPTARRRRGSAQETGGPERDRPATSFKQQQHGRTDREPRGQHNSAAETKKTKSLTRRAATSNRDPSGRNSPRRGLSKGPTQSRRASKQQTKKDSSQGQPKGRRDLAAATTTPPAATTGDSPCGDATRVDHLTTAGESPVGVTRPCWWTDQRGTMENGPMVELDIEEIIKAAREAATTRSKDWILKQIKGISTEGAMAQDERNDNATGGAAPEGEEPQTEAKKRQRNTSRSTKKGDKREAADHTEAPTPGPSKRAKANNGEQISIIVQECLKSMAPLLFAKAGGAPEARELGDTESRIETGPSIEKGRGSRAPRADTARDRTPSPDSGEEETAPLNPTAKPTQAWDSDRSTRRRRSPSAGGRAPETYKRGTLGRPYMVARAPGLASLIPLAVKERIWRREFIDIFTLLEIQVEGLDLTTVDKKEEERRERNRVRKERNFDNWLDAFRIMACIIVEKFPHCAKDLWLYESKIHEAQRQFAGEAWLDYDKGFRLKMQAHPDMEWDEEDVAGYMHKMMIAREARSWANKGEQPFRGSYQKSKYDKAKPYHKKQQLTQWKGQ